MTSFCLASSLSLELSSEASFVSVSATQDGTWNDDAIDRPWVWVGPQKAAGSRRPADPLPHHHHRRARRPGARDRFKQASVCAVFSVCSLSPLTAGDNGRATLPGTRRINLASGASLNAPFACLTLNKQRDAYLLRRPAVVHDIKRL